MEQITLEQYKNYLVSRYSWECDNTEQGRINRMSLLNNRYTDEYLENIITGTYNFANKIIKKYENTCMNYINIPLEKEPNIVYIDLNLRGGWWSDIIVNDSDNNFYSVELVKEIFGPYFSIEPDKIEFYDEIDEDDDLCIVSEIPNYYLYIQCKKEIIEEVKKRQKLKK